MFDYGDCGGLSCAERIEPAGGKRAVEVIDSADKPPKQYPDWD